jgi:hypothetical protein
VRLSARGAGTSCVRAPTRARLPAVPAREQLPTAAIRHRAVPPPALQGATVRQIRSLPQACARPTSWTLLSVPADSRGRRDGAGLASIGVSELMDARFRGAGLTPENAAGWLSVESQCVALVDAEGADPPGSHRRGRWIHFQVAPFVLYGESRIEYTGRMKMNIQPMARHAAGLRDGGSNGSAALAGRWLFSSGAPRLCSVVLRWRRA